MLNNSLKTFLIGGKAAALATMLATTALAQQAVPTPEGNVVIVPNAALEADSTISTEAVGFATLTSFDNDQAVAETLIAQGFSNLVINRTGAIMTVTGDRDGVPTVLVYSLANGRLMSVDGVDFQHPADATAAAELSVGDATSSGAASDDDGADDDAGDDTAAPGDDGADDASDDASNDGADDGADGADGAGDSDGAGDGEGDGDGSDGSDG